MNEFQSYRNNVKKNNYNGSHGLLNLHYYTGARVRRSFGVKHGHAIDWGGFLAWVDL